MCEWTIPAVQPFWSSSNPALWGLCGTILGAVLSGGSQFLIGLHKQRADKRERMQKVRTDTQRAFRMVAMDFVIAKADLAGIREDKFVREISAGIGSWSRYADDIAATVSRDEWNTLSMAAFCTINFIERIPKYVAEGALSPDTLSLLSTYENNIEEAIEVIQKWRRVHET